MIIDAQHRNYRLALRHLAALRHQYGNAELLSRRNARGRFSQRGQLFQFEVREDTGKRVQFVLHFDYAGGKAKDLLRFQVHVSGPEDVSDDEAIRIIRDNFGGDEKPLPKGWRRRSIYWGHISEGSAPDETVKRKVKDDREKGLQRLAIDFGKASVANRKITARKNRRAGKSKAAKR
jgi:hypothetical protein